MPTLTRHLLTGLLVVAGLVHLCSLYDPSPAGPDLGGSDKIGHLVLFAVPAFLGGLRGLGRWWPTLLALHAPVSEIVQERLLTTRTGDVWDMVADLVGVLVGWVGARWVVARRSRAVVRRW